MKAIVVEHRGDPGALKEVPTPSPGPHEILVRVTAAGVVSATGSRASKYREGERLFGIARAHGTYAEYTIVGEDDNATPIAKLPDGIGDADAAALPTAGLTALAALGALEVGSGTTLLILGVTGGVAGSQHRSRATAALASSERAGRPTKPWRARSVPTRSLDTIGRTSSRP